MLHGDSATHDPPFLCYTAVFQPTPAVLMLHDAFSISTRRPRATRRCCRLCPEIIRATRSSFHLYPPHPRYAAIQPLVSHSTRCVVSDPYCTGASGRILYAIQTVEIMTTSYLDCSLTCISRSGIQSSLPDAKTSHEHQNAQGGSHHHGAREANQRSPHPLYPSTIIPLALTDRLPPRQRKMGCESATPWRNIRESNPIARLEQGGRINSGIEQANFCPPDQMPSTG